MRNFLKWYAVAVFSLALVPSVFAVVSSPGSDMLARFVNEFSFIAQAELFPAANLLGFGVVIWLYVSDIERYFRQPAPHPRRRESDTINFSHPTTRKEA